MSDDAESDETDEVLLDPLSELQAAIVNTDDEDAVLAGYAVVAEWIESDGTMTMTCITSPMPPWHLYGLLSFGRDSYAPSSGDQSMVDVYGDDDGEDEDFSE